MPRWGKGKGKEKAEASAAAHTCTPQVASDGSAGLLAPGSTYSRPFPRGQPPRGSIRAVVSSGFVPGYSGGGRAGIAPASLLQTRLTDPAWAGRQRHRTVDWVSNRSPTVEDRTWTGEHSMAEGGRPGAPRR